MNYIINDHKVGFTVSSAIRDEINKYDKIENLTFYKFWNINNRDDRYICFIRNPYEIIISGYLYHKKCREEWCINKNVNYFNYWKDKHFLENKKKENIDLIETSIFSKKETYQSLLNSKSQDQGILHEMKNVSKITIDGMSEFDYYNYPNVEIVKMENILSDFDREISRILNFFEIEPSEELLKCLKRHNVRKQKSNSHVTNKDFLVNRYVNYFNDELYAEFNIIHKKNIDKLEYLGYKIHK